MTFELRINIQCHEHQALHIVMKQKNYLYFCSNCSQFEILTKGGSLITNEKLSPGLLFKLRNLAIVFNIAEKSSVVLSMRSREHDKSAY
jgi:hypothetical protein